MTLLRRHILGSGWQVAALIMASLLIKMLVPMGFMPGMVNGTIVMQPCESQRAGPAMSDAMATGDHGHTGHSYDPGDGDQHGKLQTPCAFAGLASFSLPAVDPVLLAIAIAVIISSAFRITAVVTRQHGVWLRPPSQGPPATA